VPGDPITAKAMQTGATLTQQQLQRAAKRQDRFWAEQGEMRKERRAVFEAGLAALSRVRFQLYELESADTETLPPRVPTAAQQDRLRAAVEELFATQQLVEARVPILEGDREQYADISPAVVLERAAQLAERCRSLLSADPVDARAFGAALGAFDRTRRRFLAQGQLQLAPRLRPSRFKRLLQRLHLAKAPALRELPSDRLFSDETTEVAELVQPPPVRTPDRRRLPPGRG
jgi:hypothetical protein